MSYPLVSIVTPSYCQNQFLEETLLSVQRQDYPHIEHIVVDGGSTDGSVDTLKRHQQHLAQWVSEPDQGQTHAVIKGFQRATGTIFAQLNADDLLAPSAVRLAVHFLSTSTNVGLVYGDRLSIDAKGNTVGIMECPPHDPKMFVNDFTLPHESTFFLRSAYEATGGMDQNLHFSMDFDLWCKMAKVTEMQHIPAFMGYYRQHQEAKSVVFEQQGSGDKFAEEHRMVYRRHFHCQLPSRARKRLYRLRRNLRRYAEKQSKRYRHQQQIIQSLWSERLASEERT